MSIIRALHLRHHYEQSSDKASEKMALDDISIEIEKGTHVAILGHNGSGKSTLARHLNALLRPTEGTVWIDGMDTKEDADLLKIRKTAGMVFQNPDNQIVADVVEEDVAFGPENIGVPTDEIWQRVSESLDHAGITKCRYQSPNRLSGGQKQRVAIAGVMAMQPAVMILDEATAMLDPRGRRQVMETVRQLNKKAHVTVIWITHDMEEAVMADRVIVLNKGKIVLDDTPEKVFVRTDLVEAVGLTLPPAAQIAAKLRRSGIPVPADVLSIEALTDVMTGYLAPSGDGKVTDRTAAQPSKMQDERALLELKHVSYIYNPGTSYEVRALDDIELAVSGGSFIGLIGETGSGKSTLLQLLNGLLKPSEGHVLYEGQDVNGKSFDRRLLCAKVGLVFQNSEYQLFEETVLKDVCFGPLNLGKSTAEAEKDAKEALALVGLDETVYDRSPFELSGGQMRRTAIAGILAMRPEVLVLDEPAAGLDPKGKTAILELANKLRKTYNMTIIWSSHAMEDAAAYADRLIVMHEGRIVRDGSPRDIFKDEEGLTAIGLAVPSAARLTGMLKARGIDLGCGALTACEAAEAILKYHERYGGGEA